MNTAPFQALGVAWPSAENRVADIATGGFLQSMNAATLLARAHRLNTELDPVCDPGLAGYCLDAPEFLLAGSHFGSGRRSVPNVFLRLHPLA